jgi:adenylate kinase family enzyme
MRIHIVGASGAGTTTLGRALAGRLTCPHLDTDDAFWLPSDPPCQRIRDRAERQAVLGAELTRYPHWVLSGSLCGWGDLFVPLFQRVVFLWVPPDDIPERCRRLHEEWLAALPCPVQRIMDAGSTEDHLETIIGGVR